jgi:ABC-type dipeptide/oligopeptide/nickel transport system permease subunit
LSEGFLRQRLVVELHPFAGHGGLGDRGVRVHRGFGAGAGAGAAQPLRTRLPAADGRIQAAAWSEEGDATFKLGTDDQGRDVLSAIMYGARVSLLVGFCAVLFSTTLGVTIGLLAGYLGGKTDAVLMRIADIS